MRIVFLTQWFFPEPSFKGLPFARELVKRGHAVTIITGFPNYPGGKVYPGYRIRLWHSETIDGISVIRVPLFPSHDRSATKRVLNYLSFALAAATIGVVRLGRADVAYVYHPPASIGVPLLVLAWVKRIPCVYDINDLWPDTLASTGMITHPTLVGAVGLWCRLVYAVARRIVVVSPGFRSALIERGVQPEKISLIYNWSPDEGASCGGCLLNSIEAKRFVGRFNLLYAGNMGPAQDLHTVIAAAKILAERAPRIQFVFVGDGIQLDELQAAAVGLPNVIFLARRPAAEMPSLYAAADALLVHLKDDPLFAITIPSKVQTYLAMGRPVLACLRGDGADLVLASGAGVVCAPGQPAALADAAEKLSLLSPVALEAMGRAGQRYYSEHLSMEVGLAAFENEFVAAAREI